MADSLRRRMMMGQGGETDPAKMYLTFKALESGTFSFSRNAISYSLDGGSTWSALAAGAASPTVAAGKEICWKARLTPSSNYGIGTFSATGLFDAYGNIMSMSDGDDYATATTITNVQQFRVLFQNNTYLLSAQNLILPATTLANYCYLSLFDGCSSLTTAPELPATTLANYCYQRMFYGCTSLTTAPELPVETLANYCYQSMFQGCTSLTTAPVLPATTLVPNCYRSMFEGCSSLTTAPELPATWCVEYCYYRMFRDCSALNYIKCLATQVSATDCVYSWVTGVSSTGTFVKAASMSSWTSGTSGIPSGWTVENA